MKLLIFFIVIFSFFVKSRINRHELATTSTTPDIFSDLDPQQAREYLKSFSFSITSTITRNYNLYHNGWINTDIDLLANSRVTFKIENYAITLISEPPFRIRVPGPNFQLTHFRYKFSDNSVKAYLDADWEILGLTRRALRYLIQNHVKDLFMKHLPYKMKQPHYLFFTDTNPIATIKEIKNLFKIFSGSSSPNLNNLPIRDPSIFMTVKWPNILSVPLFGDYALKIGKQTLIFFYIDCSGSFADLRLTRFKIRMPTADTAPEERTVVIEDTSGGFGSSLSVIGFKTITYYPPQTFKFEYSIGIENLVNGLKQLASAIDQIRGFTPRSVSDYKLDGARAVVDEKLQSEVPKFFNKMVEQIEPLISFINIRRFLSMEN